MTQSHLLTRRVISCLEAQDPRQKKNLRIATSLESQYFQGKKQEMKATRTIGICHSASIPKQDTIDSTPQF